MSENDIPTSHKTRRRGSKTAQGVIEAAIHKQTGMVDNRMGRPASAYDKKKTEELLSGANQPLTKLEVEGIGAGGELMLNMVVPLNSHNDMQLRDVVKDPSMITASAEIDRLRLAQTGGALDLSLDATDTIEPRNSLEKMLSHQMATVHALAMRLAGTANAWIDKATPDGCSNSEMKREANIEAARAANATAKMMQTFQQGFLTLQRIRSGGKQQVTVVHQHVQVAGGTIAVAGIIEKDKYGG